MDANSRQAGQPRAWQFRVPQRDAAITACGGTYLDLNSDGYVDFALTLQRRSPSSTLYIGYGGDDGPDQRSLTPYRLQAANGFNLGLGPVESVGDINGDGFGDIVIADDRNLNPDSLELGRVSLWYGSASGPIESGFTYVATQRDNIGAASALGDLNGDGFGDFALYVDPTVLRVGNDPIVVVYGASRANAMRVEQLRTLPYAGIYPRQARGAGDSDGDGYSDLLLPRIVPARQSERFHPIGLIRGAPAGLNVLSETTLSSSAGNMFGFGGTSTGIRAAQCDINGDGYPDVVLLDNRFRSIAFLGGAEAISAGTELMVDASVSGVSCGGDMDGDGRSDVGIGRPDAVQIFLDPLSRDGARRQFAAPKGWQFIGEFLQLGCDFNGDGYDDAVVPLQGDHTTEERVFVIFGNGRTGGETRVINLPDSFYFGGLRISI